MAEAKTVYVIDDDSALSAAYSLALSNLGYTVRAASDGVEGVALLKNGLPAAILLDILMPNLDGYNFLKQLRADPAAKDVKVIVVSNFEAPLGIEKLGVAKYLSKMQNSPEAVAAVVDRLLKA